MKTLKEKYWNQSPVRLTRRPFYWLRYRFSFLIVFFLILPAVYGLYFLNVLPVDGINKILIGTFDRIDGINVAIQVVVLLVACSALGLTGRLVARFDLEQSIAMYVHQRAEDYLVDIMSENSNPPDLDRIPEIWPQKAWPNLTVKRIFDTIHKDAQDSQFGTREIIVRHALDELEETASGLQSKQSNALHLGILGTFLGMIQAMPEIVNLLAEGTGSPAFGPLFNALTVCFSTSVTGLMVAIWISVMQSRVQAVYLEMSGHIDDMANNLLNLSRKAVNRWHVAKTLENLGKALDQVNINIVEQNNVMELQTTTIGEGFSSIIDTKEHFAEFMKQITDLQESVGKELVLLETNAQKGVERVADIAGDAVEAATRTLASLHESCDSLIETIEKVTGESVNQLSTGIDDRLVKATDHSLELIERQSQIAEKGLKRLEVGFTSLHGGIKKELSSATQVVRHELQEDLKRMQAERAALEKLKVEFSKDQHKFHQLLVSNQKHLYAVSKEQREVLKYQKGLTGWGGAFKILNAKVADSVSKLANGRKNGN